MPSHATDPDRGPHRSPADAGTPNPAPSATRACTPIGLTIDCTAVPVQRGPLLAQLTEALDTRRGLLLSSGYEYPGRYHRYELGFVDPPLSLSARGRDFTLQALNPRGRVLVAAARRALCAAPELALHDSDTDRITGSVPPARHAFTEEQRTRQPTVLSVVRRLSAAFATPGLPHVGLYGAFGYDLCFQFDDLQQRRVRAADQRDLVLYLPDRLLVGDHARGTCQLLSLEFTFAGERTAGLPVTGTSMPVQLGPTPDAPATAVSDHAPGQYADLVRSAQAAFARGDLFEVTPGQTFSVPLAAPPSTLFHTLQRDNPAPYAFFANLGQGEHLVGASPEMFVRVAERRVETCPIAGTIARGADALADAEQIRTLLACDKSVAELTMCTDVDRNDKARICEPGSVQVIGRRQIELYSRLIHTVDHVQGTLRPGYDALDAFITHCWAVTVTGAPKQAAMQFIEDHERSPRRFYGGAVGVVGFDGSLNTGLVLRTVRIAGGQAEVRAGATLLHASDPDSEARECELKASALLSALRACRPQTPSSAPPPPAQRSTPAARVRPTRAEPVTAPRVLLVDHRDSFVHTLGDYFRQAGAEVNTLRAGFDPQQLERLRPQLVVLSPGPGTPADFDTRGTLDAVLARGLPVFGVCLGLQALVEYYGGRLAQLATPRHGSPSPVEAVAHPLFEGLPQPFAVGRYHSLHGDPDALPAELSVLARSADDGCVMAVGHRTLPLLAVQFHPESIMSASGGHGLRLLRNALSLLTAVGETPAGVTS